MKRNFHLLFLALFLSAGVLTQYGCGSSEPAVVVPVDSVANFRATPATLGNKFVPAVP